MARQSRLLAASAVRFALGAPLQVQPQSFAGTTGIVMSPSNEFIILIAGIFQLVVRSPSVLFLLQKSFLDDAGHASIVQQFMSVWNIPSVPH